MSVFENIFEKISSFSKKKQKLKIELSEVTFEDEFITLTALCSLLSGSPHIIVKNSQGIGHIFNDTIFLPEKINFFDNKELNRAVFLHKAIVAGCIRKHGICYSKTNLSLGEKGQEIWAARQRVLNNIQRKLPNYEDYFRKILEHCPTSIPDLKKRENFPLKDFMLWCELMPSLNKKPKKEEQEYFPKTKLEENIDTEIQGKNNAETEVVYLNKENENPVAHSFEKLETADEYRGGFKTVDNSDELQKHSNALDELNLKKVTRDGASSQSLYKSSTEGFFKNVIIKSKAPRFENFLHYPEWDFKRKQSLPRFCRLYVLSKNEAQKNSSEFITKLVENYHSELKFWEPRLWSVVNQRKNMKGQLEGQEIDIDSCIRYITDMKVTGQGDPRLYMRDLLKRRDISTLILLDQSLSTDSWVSNRRVLDLELESIGLTGVLLKDMNDPIMIAGTWSETRNHCHFQIFKEFDGSWSDFFNIASQITPQGYTRLGPAIRHASKLLSQTASRKKILILLTDGKPTDFDQYEGRYGIEDIRHAILEGQEKGVTVKALAIDKEAKHYFPLLFGNKDYQILSDPAQLPQRLFKIYAELALNKSLSGN